MVPAYFSMTLLRFSDPQRCVIVAKVLWFTDYLDHLQTGNCISIMINDNYSINYDLCHYIPITPPYLYWSRDSLSAKCLATRWSHIRVSNAPNSRYRHRLIPQSKVNSTTKMTLTTTSVGMTTINYPVGSRGPDPHKILVVGSSVARVPTKILLKEIWYQQNRHQERLCISLYER